MAKVAKNKQMAVLNYIHKQVEDHGYPPTVREICSAVGLSSTSTVHGHISRLIEQGFLQKDPSKPRALEITSKGLDILGVKPTQKEIPMLGVVTAGQPILAVENATDFFPIPPSIQDNNDLFMLTIRGTSMVKAGIFNGDQVIVRKQSTAKNGDIVIAMNDDNEATCKRFYKEKTRFRLQPENDTMEPIFLDNVKILGKVVGLFRDHIF
ncbi:transcriptional repressor LexA [Limosilactobacillus agrestis]|uniref:LexA repressor n=1 Tax=Limosilactobacillus agrestis TaxID=2759748 RepID=A0A7W3UGR5_9LACO|nr:transcriptional repressor LexA [Limosilactobacillus agrestis]MBD5090524.1 transcriptional repressor LexA [Lactobacillus sp.]MBB1095329.1 transcriptional repressor LexA [Limosilactobacillus agrestis]MBB1099458.1 transcriptional repressor LexA [Limosilactobacillus agrestis]MCD7112868.1 transcriptional repressor LexA [Limosilactobacillus agrestis]MCD7120406.1 transcriptional repressor LexA [Limosilactobacillus agrestis]